MDNQASETENNRDVLEEGLVNPDQDVDISSLDEIDALLFEEDPDLENALSAISAETLNNASSLQEENALNQAASSDPESGTEKIQWSFSWATVKQVGWCLLLFFQRTLVQGLEHGKKLITQWQELSFKKKFLLLSVGGLAIAAVSLAISIPQTRHFYFRASPFMTSFSEVADTIIAAGDSGSVPINQTFFVPEYIVLLPKMTVNLRSLNGSGNPMGAFEFFVETTSQHSAVLLKKHEKEVIDIVQRTLEQLYYQDIARPKGKEKMKNNLKQQLNRFLSSETIKAIYIKTMVTKP